jgi:EAL domain-containing protein (putative c-di-GMP-specific phosphodiesterase class I)
MHALRAQQCDVMQGYLVSRPVPGAEITKMLSRTTHATAPEGIGADVKV